ncbi:AraC family transcriptional regulator [Castellaniella sp.]|uniref:AraC family transcriptional regulator n=1 Tax=Castellaniella sp. TaxID=1955812 RepID=UPI003C7299F7
MIDPFSEVVMLLQPGAPFSKIVSGAGAWRVSREESGQVFYCAILEGACLIQADEHEPITLQEGDFVLIPSAHNFAMSSLEPPPDGVDAAPVALPDGEFRLGVLDVPPDVRSLVGYCVFGAPDAALLVPLLPQLVLARGESRLMTLVQLVGEECRARRPARDVVLARLLEVLLVEALRTTSESAASPGLLRGLADERLSVSIRRMHEMPARRWTVAQLATEAALSRSAFFERFSRIMGTTPMEYLSAWRMALAKDLLLRGGRGLADIAERVGYSSVNTFSVAFTRHVGVPPGRYARRP